MTTPSMLLTRWMGRGFLMVGAIVLTTFLVSITYEMHAEYNRQLIQRLEDEYLFEKCEDPEFFNNIRGRTQLCTDIREHRQQWLFLRAANQVALRVNWCGTWSCTELMHGIMSRFGWKVVGFFFLALMMVPQLFLTLFQSARRQAWGQREQAIRNYNKRFGMPKGWEGEGVSGAHGGSHSVAPFYEGSSDGLDSNWKCFSLAASVPKHRKPHAAIEPGAKMVKVA